jgi:hypothetical protein
MLMQETYPEGSTPRAAQRQINLGFFEAQQFHPRNLFRRWEDSVRGTLSAVDRPGTRHKLFVLFG